MAWRTSDAYGRDVIKRTDRRDVRLSTSAWLATNQHDKEYGKEEVVLERSARYTLPVEGVCGQ